ncbi:hypothetical protein ACTRXD_18125 [Nitrospira sp. T9]|uniref:hypothetical protein n=1 Tax=unclassified Nitrospira TaxID=2652172 RepID=UPI003F9A65A2
MNKGNHPALGAAKYHSGIEREIQIDHVGIQADRSIREAELAYADRMPRQSLQKTCAKCFTTGEDWLKAGTKRTDH